MSDGNEKLYDFQARSDASALVCLDKSRTVQSDAEDADINVIVMRYGLTGTMPQGLKVPEYTDYDEVFDFHSAQMVLARAEESFMSIPANIRAEFNNDPGMFLDFCSLEENIPRMRELGLAIPKEIVDTNVPVVTDVVK